VTIAADCTIARQYNARLSLGWKGDGAGVFCRAPIFPIDVETNQILDDPTKILVFCVVHCRQCLVLDEDGDVAFPVTFQIVKV
jgi:hypothetical protein